MTQSSASAHKPGAGLPRPVEAPLAAVGLVAAAPILVLACLAVGLTSSGPVLFRQDRVGRHGRRFRLYKLRTMRSNQVGPAVTAGDDPRITRIGRLLRRTKLDELPELWNVVRGDMSLVGPRPEVPEYVDLADPLWQEVLQARPGLTDPVTIQLRDEEALLSGMGADRERYYRETLQPLKMRGYRDYQRTRTWRSDVRVLFRTALAILRIGKRSDSGPTGDLTKGTGALAKRPRLH